MNVINVVDEAMSRFGVRCWRGNDGLSLEKDGNLR